MKKGWAFDAVALAASLAIFGFFSLQQLDLPGLYYDEAADAVPAMQLVLGQKVELLNQTGLLVHDLALPIMAMDYVGAVNTYLLVPLFALLGTNVVSLRLLTILGSALTIIFSYFLSKDLFDRPVAAVAVILLAVHPSFVFWSRQGIHVTSIMTVMSTASLFCLLMWRRRRHRVFLYLAAFLLGLGLSAKLLFLWFILALAGCAIVLLAIPKTVSHLFAKGRRASGKAERPADWDETVAPVRSAHNGQSAMLVGAAHRSHPVAIFIQVIGYIVAFALGAWMILLYNLMTGGTLAVLSKNLITTSYGVNNLAFFDNLPTALDAFRVYLRGENFWYLGGLFADDWYPAAFAISAVGTLAALIYPQARKRWQSLLFPLAMVALIIAQSSFTISGLWATHFFIAYPFPQLSMAAFAVTAARLVPIKKVAAALVVTAIAFLVAKDVYVNFEYHRVLSKTGGLFTHSDAIYRLANYVDGRGVTEPIAMDWGIKTSLQILTQGRINPIEIFQYEKDPNLVFFDWLYGSLTKRPDTLYIFHAEGSEVFPRYEAFLTLARKLDKKVVLEQTILRKDGAPLYTVYSAR